MVVLHVKQGDESLFLITTELKSTVDEVLNTVVEIHNGRLKVQRIVNEMHVLCELGPSLPPEMHGLLEDQIEELKLKDEWAETNMFDATCSTPDPLRKRSGRAPSENHCKILRRSMEEAKGIISSEKVKCNTSLCIEDVKSALDILKGAIMITYPMGLPLYDPIRCEIENRENLEGTQDAKLVLDPSRTCLWFASKELKSGQKLKNYFGTIEKTKAVIKIQDRSLYYPPAREPILTEEQRKELMLSEFRRRETLKKLDENNDDSYLNSRWADPKHLQKSFQGLTEISWKPK